MSCKLLFCYMMLGLVAIGLFVPVSALAQDGCPTDQTFRLNGTKVTQQFLFNGGNAGDLVDWTFKDCATGFETCGVATVVSKDACKVRIVTANDAYNVDAEVNLCLNQGKAKGKGTSFSTIGGGFQFTDANLAEYSECP
jgi:hypothetical protein